MGPRRVQLESRPSPARARHASRKRHNRTMGRNGCNSSRARHRPGPNTQAGRGTTEQWARNGCNSSRARRRPGPNTQAGRGTTEQMGPQRVQLESRPSPARSQHASRKRHNRTNGPATGATRVAPVAGPGPTRKPEEAQPNKWARNGCNSSRARRRPGPNTQAGRGTTEQMGPQRVQLESRQSPARSQHASRKRHNRTMGPQRVQLRLGPGPTRKPEEAQPNKWARNGCNSSRASHRPGPNTQAGRGTTEQMGPQRVQLESRPSPAREQMVRRNATTDGGPSERVALAN